MPLTSGEQFAGFRILTLLGSGGMGEVYLAQHPRLPRRDALKVLPAELSRDAAFRERFIREADLAASLFHPHVVGVHDRGEHDGQLWISMDYVDGVDAGRLLHSGRANGLPPSEVVEIVSAVADALDYAHTRGLLHRDVKPGNILLTRPVNGRRRIMLADFGIARPLTDAGRLTQTNVALGTLSYAAPEQLTGRAVDGRADQYALGVTTYQLLTGAVPFDDEHAAVVISHHLTSAPPPLGVTRPDLAAFDPVLAVAMAKEPVARFPQCSDFTRALTAQLGSVSRPAGPPPVVAHAAPAPPPRTPTAVLPPPRPAVRAPVPPAAPPTTRVLGWPLAIGATVAILIVGALIAIQLVRDGEPAGGAASSTSTSAVTTTASPTDITFDGMRDLVTSYYGDLPTNTESAWAKLASGYQQQTGLQDYLAFWGSIRTVTVLSVSPRDATSVTARLTYVMRDGSTLTEDRWFDVTSANGTLQIADSQIA